MGTKIITFSDLHLEFKEDFKPPLDSDADVMVLAGDIATFDCLDRLTRFLEGWEKPVIYIAGNHEYYCKDINDDPLTMVEVRDKISETCFNISTCLGGPLIYPLQDEGVEIDGVQFFGGTMWTDFDKENVHAMRRAGFFMNDYKCIYNETKCLNPSDTIGFHKEYVEKLIAWFNAPLSGPRVVISHHSPVFNHETKYAKSDLWPAYLSLDMPAVIGKYQPALVIYGHTHECDDQVCGDTRVISNQRGYPMKGHLCEGFDPQGKMVEV